MNINTRIQRLSLHDSHFELVKRVGTNIELTFDWATLEDFAENNVEEVLILGKTVVLIKGISNEQLRGYYDGTNWKPIETTLNFVDSWQEVANTEIDEANRKIQLDGMFNTEEENFWIEWSFNYESCEVEWNSHVTLTEWEAGKLPED